MEISERVLWEDNQELQGSWIIPVVIAGSLVTTGIMLGVLIKNQTPWQVIIPATGLLLLMEGITIWIIRSMALKIKMTKKGWYYQLWPGETKMKFISWEEIEAITFKKSPLQNYGKNFKPNYGYVYVMTGLSDPGIELKLKKGNCIFLSITQPEVIKTVIRKSDIQTLIKTE